MASDLDPFFDILPQPASINARAGGKFQPKAKPRPRKVSSASVPSSLPIATKEKPVILASTGSETTESFEPVDVVPNKLTAPFVSSLTTSDLLESKVPLKNNEDSSSEVPTSDDLRSAELADPLSELVATKDGLGSANVLPLEVAMSHSNSERLSSLGKSSAEVDPMGFNLESCFDILPEPVTSEATSSDKFNSKDVCTSVSSIPSKGTKEKPNTLASSGLDTTQSVKPVGVVDDRPTDPVGPSLATSEIIGTEDLLKGNGILFLDDNRSSVVAHASLQVPEKEEDMRSREGLHSEVADGNDNSHSCFGQVAGEINFTGFDLDPFADVLEPSTNKARAGGKFRPKAKPRPRKETSSSVTSAIADATAGKFVQRAFTSSVTPQSTSCVDDAENRLNGPVGSSLATLEIGATGEPLEDNSCSFLENPFSDDNGSLGLGNPLPHIVAADTLDSSRENADIFPEWDYLGSLLSPATTATDPTPEPLVSKEPMTHVNSDAVIPEDDVHPEAASKMPQVVEDDVHLEAAPKTPQDVSTKVRKRRTSTVANLSQEPQKSLRSGVENEYGESSRRLRKCTASRDPTIGSQNGDHDNDDFPCEPSVIDENENNDDDYREENTSQKKRAQRKSKKPVTEKEKPVRKRKKRNEVPEQQRKKHNEVPEQKAVKPPKKFSHSTRRNKRCVDRALLETPEDEIDPQKVPFKDLILLAEYRERKASKEATTSTASMTSQRNASQNGEETYGWEEDRDNNDDQANESVQQISNNFNYQSYMNKTPTVKWTKQDTENFYKGVRQFGTDFLTISTMFKDPPRTRRQILLKYKKEERQNPLMLSEALTSRPKDHSVAQLLIDQLQQAAAQEERELYGDDYIGGTGEDEMEAPIPATNENEEVAVAEKEENGAAEVDSLVKNDESEDAGYKSEVDGEYGYKSEEDGGYKSEDGGGGGYYSD